jgi:AraC-like DNA-binding protein
MDWLTVAIQFGYSDYNHMAKDFKQFANVTPNIMIHEYARRPEAVLLNL